MEPDYFLQHRIRTCQKCPLAATRLIAVPAEVGVDYQPGGIAILAEAPGACEDGSCTHRHEPAVAGRPMVGTAGKLLDRLLLKAGLARDQIVIMNMVRCRPPGNRLGDHPEAIDYCNEWLQAEMAAYAPRVVVLMGATAIASIFGAQATVGHTAGHARSTGGREYVATYHPAAALYGQGGEIQEIIVRDLWVAVELNAGSHQET